MENFKFELYTNSIYQMFWVMYDISRVCLKSKLDFNSTQNFTLMIIYDSDLSYEQIETILLDNDVNYNLVD
ncbi:MAG: hypothetical protein CML04_01300 [Pseudozobellia sp.]|nr:hypothetical protein [Pseudozobellia sp.]MBG48820.1 hypothetical protein [Pseudozobellia sp.]